MHLNSLNKCNCDAIVAIIDEEQDNNRDLHHNRNHNHDYHHNCHDKLNSDT